MSKVLSYKERQSKILDKLAEVLIDGNNDFILSEIEDLLDDVIYDLEEKEEEIEELNNYLDDCRR